MRLSLHMLASFLLCCVVGLPALAGPDEQPVEIDKLIRQLGDEDFDRREAATEQLARIGEAALPALKKAAADSSDAEVKQRAMNLLTRIEKVARGELMTIQGPAAGYWLNRVAFTKDGKQAIATGGAVIWYDLETGKELKRTLEKPFARSGLALTKDGRYFATGHQNDHDIQLGEVENGKAAGVCKGHAAGVWAVAFSEDGSRVVSGSDDKTMRVWEFKTGKEILKIDHGKYKVRAVAFSPDGKQLASGTGGTGNSFPVYLWNVESGKQVQTFPGHQRDAMTVQFTPDGKRLLTAGLDGSLVVWDVETGKELRRMGKGVIYHAALSPDGKRVLTAGYTDRAVRLWDLDKEMEIKKFDGHSGNVLDVAFSPDGKRALSCDTEYTIKLWKLPE